MISVARVKQVSNQESIDEWHDLSFEPEAPEQVSPEEAFVARTEALRLQQEWTHDLDMRQFVTAPCQRRRYRSRFFWLDEASHKLFHEGLGRDGGVFTVATYEEIIADARLKAGQRLRHAPANGSAVPARLATMYRTNEAAVQQLHEVLKLGYFEKRRKDRIKFTTRVLLIGDGPILPGRTRDISETGIQIQTAFLGDYRVGDVVQVKFPNLPEIKDAQVRYRMIRIIHKLNINFVSLRCVEEDSHPVTALVHSLFDRQGDSEEGQLYLDAEDASLTAESLLAERHYMHSTASLPFFLAHDGPHGVRMTMVCYNEANEESLVAFKTDTGGNGFAETMNRRHLGHFMRLARADGQRRATVAVWRAPDGGGLETLMDLECRKLTDWYAHLAKHRHADEFRAFRVIVRRVRRPNDHRLARELEPLAAKSPDHAEQLLRDGSHLVALGALIDYTAEIRAWNLTPYESVPIKAICQDAKNRGYRGTGQPELLPIDYVERTRVHDRYLLQVPVNLAVQGTTIAAVTRDISVAGMSILLPEGAPNMALGVSVRVTLSGLAQQAGMLARLRGSLEGVSYQVMGADVGKEVLLRLQLQEPDGQKEFTQALSVYLKKKQSILHIERTHSVQAAATRLYSSFFIEASATLPVLYFRSKADDSTPVARVCMTQKPSPLAAFFETADGKFDFSAITTPAWTSHLYSEMAQHGRSEINVYLVKERIPNQSKYAICAVSDFQFADRAERDAFLDDLGGQDFRIIKIAILPPRLPAETELALALKRFERYSARRAAKLREDFADLVAVGDVVDITNAFNELHYIAPQQ